jgi:hypothetical protein
LRFKSGPESDGHRSHSCDGALGDPGRGGCGKVPQGAPRGPRLGPRNEGAQETAVKAKEGPVCVIEKGRKEEKRIKVKGS